MKLLYPLFLLFCIFYSFQNNAQNFPYLNASTGCEGQYVVDKDTNVFMYHGNQLEKFDKNFNPIWMKTYDGISFNNLLLSKTGSLYFSSSIDGIYGKLDKNGNCEWAKTLDITPNKLFLDRNNHLIISGTDNNGYFIKSDTLGSVIKCRFFTNITTGLLQLNKFIIINDSAGVYTFAWDAMCFEWGDAGVLKYDDNTDSVTCFNGFANLSEPAYVNNSLYTTSQFEQGVFYSVINWTPRNGPASNHFFVISKYSNNLIQWSNSFDWWANSNITINSFIEDANKNVLYTASLGNNFTNYHNGGCKIDSAGFASESFGLFNYSWPPQEGQKIIKSKLHSLYGSTYFFDIYGDDFPQNPLTVSVLDSLRSNCTTHGSSSMTRSGAFPLISIDGVHLDSTVYIPGDITITNSLVADSIIHDYCLATSNLERISKNILTITPNPVVSELTINSNSNLQTIESVIFDIDGKRVLKSSSSKINVSELIHGIYFIKVKTDQGEFSQKVIKE